MLTSDFDSVPSEAYLLSAALNDRDVFLELSSVVSSDMFSSPLYAELWEHMTTLLYKDEPTDYTSVIASNMQLSNRIGVQKIIEIHGMYIGRSSVPWHMNKVMELHTRRTVVDAATELREKAFDTTLTIEQLTTAFETIALQFSQTASGGLSGGISEATTWFTDIEERKKDPHKAYGMLTGWKELDKLTLGWQRKDLIVVGGRTSVGKTAFATENIIRMRNRGQKVAVFSLEMSKEQMRNRIASNLADVPLSMIRLGRLNNEELLRLGETMGVIADILIDDERGVTCDYIVAQMMRQKRKEGLDFVVVDYLQEIIEPPQANDNTGSALARVARKLRKAAAQCDCAVMALSQLNREADGKPQLRHLSGSSGIESAADVTILLHRDKENVPEILEVNVAKQRNGKTGECNLYYDTTKQRIGANDERE